MRPMQLGAVRAAPGRRRALVDTHVDIAVETDLVGRDSIDHVGIDVTTALAGGQHTVLEGVGEVLAVLDLLEAGGLLLPLLARTVGGETDVFVFAVIGISVHPGTYDVEVDGLRACMAAPVAVLLAVLVVLFSVLVAVLAVVALADGACSGCAFGVGEEFCVCDSSDAEGGDHGESQEFRDVLHTVCLRDFFHVDVYSSFESAYNLKTRKRKENQIAKRTFLLKYVNSPSRTALPQRTRQHENA